MLSPEVLASHQATLELQARDEDRRALPSEALTALEEELVARHQRELAIAAERDRLRRELAGVGRERLDELRKAQSEDLARLDRETAARAAERAALAEEVAAQVPSLVEEFVRKATDAYLMQRRSEMAYEAIYDDIEAEMPSIAAESINDVKSELVFDALDAVEALSKEIAPEALEEVAAQAERDRKNAAEKAVRETCETHVLRTASLRHLAGALGAKSTSLEVYHYLSLRATALQVGRLDDALRRCVSLRDRLENEPLLAEGVRAAIADAGVELLQAQVQSALNAEEAALQRREDEAYGRIALAPAPASSVAHAPAPAMARSYSVASELG